MHDNQKIKEISEIKPWNSSGDPLKVNSIRYNQDFSLLTLGTSKGYRIFLTSNFSLCNIETEITNNFGDIMIAMVYYKSSLVFLLPSKYKEKYSNKELIIYDDFYQCKLASFKDKNEEIKNFFLSKNVLSVVTLNKIIIIELYSFKTIEIIEKINFINKLISFNFNDYICYTYLQDKKTVYIKKYESENYKIVSQMNKIINSSFNFIQMIQISPSGDLIGLVTIFGNKIHIYYTHTAKLKECIYVGPTILTLEKMFFSEKKPNYLLLLNNANKFYIYKLNKGENAKCICDKYDDNNIINGGESKSNVLGFIRKCSKNKDIKEVHAYSESDGRLLFLDFDRNKHKDLILIGYDGQLNKYHFNKKKTGKMSQNVRVQWI